MGIYHLAPVGTSPGAVTSALSYLKHEKEEFSGFRGSIVEGIVLFISQDVWDGKILTDCVYNEYMSINTSGRQPWKNQNIIRAITKFLKAEFASKSPTVYCVIVNPQDFNNCFTAIAKAVLALGRPEGVGKNIWANMTGGTNVLNAALLHVAFLSGLIARIYYTFVAEEKNRQYLQPPSRDKLKWRWDEIPVFKTHFDEGYYQIIKILAEKENWCKDQDLLSHLKQANPSHFKPFDVTILRQQFLNKMEGRELEQETSPDGSATHRIKISDYGNWLLQRFNDPLFCDLTERGRGSRVNVKDLRAELNKSRVSY